MIAWRGLVVPAALIAAAQMGAVATGMKSDSVASPAEVAAALVEVFGDGTVFRATLQTLATAVGGLAIGSAIGLTIGILLGLFRIADRLAAFSIEAVRPIPSVALIPIVMLIFGFGYRMEIAIVAFSCIWPNLILSRAAVAGIEPRLLEVARVLGFGLRARVFKIVLPAALPRIFVAFRLAMGMALIVAVTVEIAANPLGLGYALMEAQQSIRPDRMLALLVWVGVVGWAVNHALIVVEARWFGPVRAAGGEGDE